MVAHSFPELNNKQNSPALLSRGGALRGEQRLHLGDVVSVRVYACQSCGAAGGGGGRTAPLGRCRRGSTK